MSFDELARTQEDLRRFQSAEKELSDAYLRLRAKIPGALNTPHAPSAHQIWAVTESALDKLIEKAGRYDELER